MRFFVGYIALILVVHSSADGESRRAFHKLTHLYMKSGEFRRELSRQVASYVGGLKTSPPLSDPPFKCEPSKSAEVPTSVHKLLPGDIKVVGALGDSITAGNGILASTVVGILFQDRGQSFSIGGYESYSEGVITVPNMLKFYNNELYGYSTDGGSVDDEEAKFNRAIPGSTSPDMPEQGDDIITKMMEDKNVNYDKDWKMVTLFIGGNDLCRVCDDEEGLGPDAFLSNVQETLDKLYDRMPRTIVNVMPIMDITPLPTISSDIVCDGIHAVICPCAEPEHTEKLKRIQKEYATKLSELINSNVYDGKDDFTVVYQPFMRDAKPPILPDGKGDLSYFAPDCFHFSEKGHKALARNLWNSLFVSVDKKATSMTFKEAVQCPPRGTFIKTKKNSHHTPQTVRSQTKETHPVRSQSYSAVQAKADGFASDAQAPPGVPSVTIAMAVIGSLLGTAALVLVLATVAIKMRKKSATENHASEGNVETRT